MKSSRIFRPRIAPRTIVLPVWIGMLLFSLPAWTEVATELDDPVIEISQDSTVTSEECRIAIDSFPLQPEVCASSLQLTEDPHLQAELASYLAIGYARTNQPTDAREAIEQALSLNPEHWLVHANYGVMSLYLKDFQAAFESTNRALDLAEQSIPDLFLNLALAARGNGDFGVSAQAYETYLNLMGYATPEPTIESPSIYGPPDPRGVQPRSLQQRSGGNPFQTTRGVQPR